MTYLLPHEWDKYGEPPPPGDPEAEQWACQEGHLDCGTPKDCIEALQAAAEIEYEAEEFHREEARAAERRGDDLTTRAEDVQNRHINTPWR